VVGFDFEFVGVYWPPLIPITEVDRIIDSAS